GQVVHLQAAAQWAGEAVLEFRPDQHATDATELVGGELAAGAGQVAAGVVAQPVQVGHQVPRVHAEREQPRAAVACGGQQGGDVVVVRQAGLGVEQPGRVAEFHAVEVAVGGGVVTAGVDV